jgi:hypothetical protein
VWELVASCLHDRPERRPTAREAARHWAAYTDRAALVDVPLPRRASDPVEGLPRLPRPAPASARSEPAGTAERAVDATPALPVDQVAPRPPAAWWRRWCGR